MAPAFPRAVLAGVSALLGGAVGTARRVVPASRVVVPAVVLLVVLANLVGVTTVTPLLLGVSDDDGVGRLVLLIVAGGYLVLAVLAGSAAGLCRQRSTNGWLWSQREPTPEEATIALRMPADVARVSAVTWGVGALALGVVGAAVRPDPLVGLRSFLAVVLGGVVTSGISYLLVVRAGRPITARALAAHPPEDPRTLGVRARLLPTWSPDRWVRPAGWSTP